MWHPGARAGTPLRARQRALVWVWAALSLAAVYFQGRRDGLDTHVTSRVRFHAIPVAVSVLYHGRAHDYTAFSTIAFTFQQPSDIEGTLAWAVAQAPPANDPTYYWAADDRGMADYVIAAFGLFGPHIESLYSFYFVVLGISVALFLADLSWHPVASALLIFALGALYTCTSVLPLGNLTLPIFEPASMYEPRVIELLAYVATLHLALTPWVSDRWTVARGAAVAAQAAILIACYHARSTIAWELGFVLLSGGVYLLLRHLRVRAERRDAGAWRGRAILAGGWPVLCLVGGLALLKVYQHAVYNPHYFDDVGDRTIWHNALMGFWVNDRLSHKYKLRVDDTVVVDAVREYMRSSQDPRLTPEWTDHNILGSLGGHTTFNWFVYEDSARDFYRHIWKTDTRDVLQSYLIDKPREIGRVLVKAVSPLPSLAPGARHPGFRPLDPVALLIIAPGVLLLWSYAAPIGAIVGALVLLLVCSVAPGLLFYPVVHTMMGAFATVSVLGYVVLAHTVATAVHAVERHRQVPA